MSRPLSVISKRGVARVPARLRVCPFGDHFEFRAKFGRHKQNRPTTCELFGVGAQQRLGWSSSKMINRAVWAGAASLLRRATGTDIILAHISASRARPVLVAGVIYIWTNK